MEGKLKILFSMGRVMAILHEGQYSFTMSRSVFLTMKNVPDKL